ncbi:IS3 family transposase [Acidiferrobacter sp. SPIII_3]|uniref:IS3 family transposase n=1 Tax=Acidiferrobacter sp. SPIII_3 TaxID=1281578 RepID=UPI001F0BCEE8|nr:IS3 family transposase [Acidiferrobacter sp. SPIII_3]
MMRYAKERKESVIRKMLATPDLSIPELARETGISCWTLYDWRKTIRPKEAADMPGGRPPVKRQAAQKLTVVVETAGLNEAELGEYCRRHGLYPEEVKAWRTDACQALEGGSISTKAHREALMAEQRQRKVLERELARKDKALAETAALLALRKKAAAIWGTRRTHDQHPRSPSRRYADSRGRSRRGPQAGRLQRAWYYTSDLGALDADGGRGLRPAAAGASARTPNRLSEAERAEALRVVNEPRFASLPPTQIVPRLADEGRYIASESTLYRLLRAANQLAHRGRAKTPDTRPIPRHRARGANTLWCWDISYLPGPVSGQFFFLYLVLDIYSRKIVAHEVHEEESGDHAAALIRQALVREGVTDRRPLVLHQDNGSPMKASTFVATLDALGVRRSYSRPGVSDDNAYAESLFRTCKYRPGYPGAFGSLAKARAWMLAFVRWYNHHHKHRNLKFVSPAERHTGADHAIFAHRTRIYEAARAQHPERWSRSIRNWSLPAEVWLNRPTEECQDTSQCDAA